MFLFTKRRTFTVNALLSIALVYVPLLAPAQHMPSGFYGSVGININNGWEQVQSAGGERTYNFSHSTTSKFDGFFTQSLVNYSVGASLGYRHTFGYAKNRAITLDAQGFYNRQNVTFESQIDGLKLKTTANNNYGYRVALGHHFGVVHPYIFVAGILQKMSVSNNQIANGGIVNDVADDKTILADQLGTGNTFRTFVGSFLGGFGIEVPVSPRLALNVDYTPMKHVEYGLKDTRNPNHYFTNSAVINQLQIGARYYFYNPFSRKP